MRSAHSRAHFTKLSDIEPLLAKSSSSELADLILTLRALRKVLILVVIFQFLALVFTAVVLGLVGKTAVSVDKLASETSDARITELVRVILTHALDDYLPQLDHILSDTSGISNSTSFLIQRYQKYLLTQGDQLLAKVDNLFGIPPP
jgi:hypothetical protein